MSEPFFLTVEEVEEIHTESLSRFGGSAGIRDRALLESAVAMPQAGFGGAYLHVTFFDMAAAYAFHIAENQPFVDGNTGGPRCGSRFSLSQRHRHRRPR